MSGGGCPESWSEAKLGRQPRSAAPKETSSTSQHSLVLVSTRTTSRWRGGHAVAQVIASRAGMLASYEPRRPSLFRPQQAGPSTGTGGRKKEWNGKPLSSPAFGAGTQAILWPRDTTPQEAATVGTEQSGRDTPRPRIPNNCRGRPDRAAGLISPTTARHVRSISQACIGVLTDVLDNQNQRQWKQHSILLSFRA